MDTNTLVYEKPELVKHEKLREVTLDNSHNNGNGGHNNNGEGDGNGNPNGW